ncbi:MAG: sulfatase-like hydrolase/transferase [Bacteroidota bacterium]
MKNNVLVFALWIGLVSCISGTKQKKELEKRPNVLIILADDLGWNDVGFHESDIKTPNIDSLAATATLLNRFYVTPICTPTRAGLLTGKYPGRFAMRYGVVSPKVKSGLPSEEETLAEAFAKIGYKNRAAFGKWHLGHSRKEYHPLNHGFNYFYGHYNGAIDYFTHKRDAEMDWHENYRANFDQGYSTDLIAEKVSQYIATQKKEEPFLAYVAFNAPHSPMQAKTEDLIDYGYSSEMEMEDYPVGGQRNGERESEIYGKLGRGNTLRQTYSAMVLSLDDGIGQIIRSLKSSGQFKNTIIWFLSDNGGTYTFGGDNKPLRGQKHQLWEGGVRAVSFVKGVGQKMELGHSNEPIAYIDVFPTLLEMIGEAQYKMYLDGESGIDRLSGRKKEERFIYLGKGGLVSKQWKLINGQLFDIENDISEKYDVSSEYPEVVKRLTTILADFEKLDSEGYQFQDKDWVPPTNWSIE